MIITCVLGWGLLVLIPDSGENVLPWGELRLMEELESSDSRAISQESRELWDHFYNKKKDFVLPLNVDMDDNLGTLSIWLSLQFIW